MPTARQKKVAKTIIENVAIDNPMNGGDIVESSGYGKRDVFLIQLFRISLRSSGGSLKGWCTLSARGRRLKIPGGPHHSHGRNFR